jgi:predicted nicotinamide N-methyase
MLLFDYEWLDCTLQLGELSLQLESAKNFSTEQKAKGRAPLPFGAVLWPAAIVLGDVLVEHAALVQGKRVLELGCGLGVGAIVSEKLGGTAFASDGHPDMPELFRRNAQKNGTAPQYVHYDWNDAEGPGRFDVVLASDVLYEPTACTLLADAIARTLQAGGTAIVTDPGRPHWPRFLKKLDARGLAHQGRRQHVSAQRDPGLVQVLKLHPTVKREHHVLFITSSCA